MTETPSLAGFEAVEYLPKGGMEGNWVERYLFRFENGYGASVIRGRITYGGDQGLWELAVVRWRGSTHHITFSTPVADEFIGYLTEPAVAELLRRIQALPPALYAELENPHEPKSGGEWPHDD